MGLRIKNLGKGTLGTSNTTIVAAVTTGMSVLVENVIFVNKNSTTTMSLYLYKNSLSTAGLILKNYSLAVNTRYVLEEITLSAGDYLYGVALAPGNIDFLANGVEKDI
jgi:hypothetical protein